MKHFASFILLAMSLNAHGYLGVDSYILDVESGFHAGEHGVITTRDNLSKVLSDEMRFDRTIDYPTQIVRIKGDISDWKITCDKLSALVEEFFGSFIDSDRFYYNTLQWCGNDPQTELALRFSIDSYFDPISDEAIEYLKKYLSTHNGEKFLGIPFTIENAKGLVVSYNLDAGFLENPDSNSDLLVLRHGNASLYFGSNYEMLKTFVSDLYKNLYSQNRDVVLPFLNRWLGDGYDVIFGHVLGRSNYILVQPERIFLMDEGPKVFTSPLRMYFASQCFKRYANGRCM